MRTSFALHWILSLALATSAMSGAHAQLGGPSGIVGLNEEEARFLPGLYMFHKGCDYYRRGDVKSAIHSWEVAAGWAVKDAQYDLGIAYFRGRGVDVDRPRGLAWLALAAERKDEAFETSSVAAWDESTPDEQAQANAIWRELRKTYADDVALVRAENRFQQEMAHITGSRVGTPGHVKVWSRSTGVLNGTEFKATLEKRAERNFGKLPVGTVDVGPLEPIMDGEDATR